MRAYYWKTFMIKKYPFKMVFWTPCFKYSTLFTRKQLLNRFLFNEKCSRTILTYLFRNSNSPMSVNYHRKPLYLNYRRLSLRFNRRYQYVSSLPSTRVYTITQRNWSRQVKPHSLAQNSKPRKNCWNNNKNNVLRMLIWVTVKSTITDKRWGNTFFHSILSLYVCNKKSITSHPYSVSISKPNQ